MNLETVETENKSVCAKVRAYWEGLWSVPASFPSLEHVNRMLSFDHFLMISPDAFLLDFVHTQPKPKQKYTRISTHRGHNISRISPSLDDIIA